MVFDRSALSGSWISSYLVPVASQKDSGTYKCASPAGDSLDVTVHVHQGELETTLFKNVGFSC